MDFRVDERIVKEAKRKAAEDYDLVANLVSKASNKEQYIETRTQYYIKKILSQGK